VVGASVSGCLAHLQRRNVDVKMGVILLIGGLAGSSAGVFLFQVLRAAGQIDLTISLSYVLLLGTMGTFMLVDGLRLYFRRRGGRAPARRRGVHHHTWIHRLPLKMRFRRSGLYISSLVPAGAGFLVGMLSAIMGVGGGFIMIPAMIYLIGMPTSVVIGTSLFQIIFVSANVTFLQAVTNQTVDAPLALLLLIGGTIGAQIGTRMGAKLKVDELRILLAVMVLLMSAKVFVDLTVAPVDVYSLGGGIF
jgi:uncharacterized membrane protein YfcA